MNSKLFKRIAGLGIAFIFWVTFPLIGITQAQAQESSKTFDLGQEGPQTSHVGDKPSLDLEALLENKQDFLDQGMSEEAFKELTKAVQEGNQELVNNIISENDIDVGLIFQESTEEGIHTPTAQQPTTTTSTPTTDTAAQGATTPAADTSVVQPQDQAQGNGGNLGGQSDSTAVEQPSAITGEQGIIDPLFTPQDQQSQGENIGAPATETPGALGENYNSPDQAVLPEAGADGEQLDNPKLSENLGDTSEFAPQEGQILEGDTYAGNGGNFGGETSQEDLEVIPIGRIDGIDHGGSTTTGGDGQLADAATAEAANSDAETIVVDPETMKEVYADVATLVKDNPELGKEILEVISEDVQFVVQDPTIDEGTTTTPAVDLTSREGKQQALQKVEELQQQLTTTLGTTNLNPELSQQIEAMKTAIQNGDHTQIMSIMQEMQNFIPREAFGGPGLSPEMGDTGAVGSMGGMREFFRDFAGDLGFRSPEGQAIDPRAAIESIQREVMLSSAEEHLKGLKDTNPEAYQRGMEQLGQAREMALQMAEHTWMPTAFEGPWGQNENGTWGPMEPGTGGVPAAYEGPWGQNEQGVWGPMEPTAGPMGAAGPEGPWAGGREFVSPEDFHRSLGEVFQTDGNQYVYDGTPGEGHEYPGPMETYMAYEGPGPGGTYEGSMSEYMPREMTEMFKEYAEHAGQDFEHYGPEAQTHEYEHYAVDPAQFEHNIENQTANNEARAENVVNNTSYTNYTPPPTPESAPEHVPHHHDLNEAVHVSGDQHACTSPQCS